MLLPWVGTSSTGLSAVSSFEPKRRHEEKKLVALRSLALCAGIGGLDLGVKLARPEHRLVGAVERQAYCAAVLVARMGEARLDQAPIWDDLATFDGSPWRGAVDLITAGYPCQPESLAGSRRGSDDERWLWDEVWRVVREVGPALVFLENVPGHLSGTFGRVVGDMAASGWRVEWDCVPACTVGACHERDRLFVLAANPDRSDVRLEPERHQRQSAERGDTESVHACAARDATDANGQRRTPQRETGKPRRHAAADAVHRVEASDADSIGGQGQSIRRKQHSERQALGLNADRSAAADSDMLGRRCAGGEQTATPDEDGWRGQAPEGRGGHRWPWPPPEPAFRRVDDGIRHRLDVDWADRIHALGNSVVPQAAARAWRTLEARLNNGKWWRTIGAPEV